MLKRRNVRFLFRPDRAFMASLLPFGGCSPDPFPKGLHSDLHPVPLPPSYNCFSSPVAKDSADISNGAIGLTLRCCSSNPHERVDISSLQKARAFAPCPQLVRDLEKENGLEEDRDARLTDGRGAFQRGNPLGLPNHHFPGKIVVAVDVDEVLGNFVSALNRFIADRYSTNHSVSEYHVYEFFKIWKCSRHEADIRVHEFFKTAYFKTGIYPIPGARQALHRLSRFCNLSIVTSRQNAIKDHTIEWIEKHYPGLFQEIHFGNHFALNGEARSKSEICKYAA